MTDTAIGTGPKPVEKTAIRHAATVVIVHRDGANAPAVLMGQRGSGMAFMPSKYVFPGGALDPGDRDVPLAAPLGATSARRLAHDAPAEIGPALAAAALRELWEETGQILGQRGDWPGEVPQNWQELAECGIRPAADRLQFIFRAITPPGRPRRFDARFFLADAADLITDPHDLSQGCDELSHLHWVPIPQARALNLPFITEIVLAEVRALMAEDGTLVPPATVPFFDNRGARAIFRWID